MIQSQFVAKRVLLFFLLLFSFVLTAQGQQRSSRELSPLPKPDSPILDDAQTLDPTAKSRIESKILNFQKRSNPSVEIGIAIIKTTGSRSMFDYSLAVARGWGIGTRDDDNPGLLLMVAIDDREYFTQVSRDLEDELPDGAVGSIQRRFLVPEFRKGNYAKGIEDTINAYILKIEDAQGISTQTELVSIPRKYQKTPPILVNDYYGILETPAKTVMNRHLVKFRDSGDSHVTVYVTIVETTGLAPIRGFSRALTNSWDINLDDPNTRVVFLLVAMKDKTYHTLVSKSLKKTLPDRTIASIQNRYLSYAFNSYSGSYNKAISDTVNAFVTRIDKSIPKVDFTKGNPDGFRGYDGYLHYLSDSWFAILVGLILVIIILLIFASLIFSESNESSYSATGYNSTHAGSYSGYSSNWNSGSSSGSFGGFGGGGDFGGGGAGGSW